MTKLGGRGRFTLCITQDGVKKVECKRVQNLSILDNPRTVFDSGININFSILCSVCVIKYL